MEKRLQQDQVKLGIGVRIQL